MSERSQYCVTYRSPDGVAGMDFFQDIKSAKDSADKGVHSDCTQIAIYKLAFSVEKTSIFKANKKNEIEALK